MTKRKTLEELMDGRDIRRGKQEDRFLDKLDRKLAAADAFIGELMREGTTIFYINVRSAAGRLTGATREFAHRAGATDYLIRNRYV